MWTSSKRQGSIAYSSLTASPKTYDSVFWRKCGIYEQVEDWHGGLGWAISFLQKKCFLSILLRISWCSYIYQILKERTGECVAGWGNW